MRSLGARAVVLVLVGTSACGDTNVYVVPSEFIGDPSGTSGAPSDPAAPKTGQTTVSNSESSPTTSSNAATSVVGGTGTGVANDSTSSADRESGSVGTGKDPATEQTEFSRETLEVTSVDTSGQSTGEIELACEPPADGFIPQPSEGIVQAHCNAYAIEGAWYCFADAVGETSCVAGEVPWDEERGEMCVSGMTVEASSELETYPFGAGVGFSLSLGVDRFDRAPFNAGELGIVGFEFEVVGATEQLPLRIVVTTQSTPRAEGSSEPELQRVGAGHHMVFFDELQAPEWAQNAGERVDPTSLFDVQVSVVGGLESASYDWCLRNLRPLME